MGESSPRPDLSPFDFDPVTGTKKGTCRWCGEVDHVGKPCPLVRAFEFDPLTGALTRVEFLVPADYGRQPSVALDEPDQYPRKRSAAYNSPEQ